MGKLSYPATLSYNNARSFYDKIFEMKP